MEAIFSSGLPGGSIVQNMPAEMQVQSLGQEDPLEKDMATHSNILFWSIPWTEKPAGLQVHGVEKESDMTQWLNKKFFLQF